MLRLLRLELAGSLPGEGEPRAACASLAFCSPLSMATRERGQDVAVSPERGRCCLQAAQLEGKTRGRSPGSSPALDTCPSLNARSAGPPVLWCPGLPAEEDLETERPRNLPTDTQRATGDLGLKQRASWAGGPGPQGTLWCSSSSPGGLPETQDRARHKSGAEKELGATHTSGNPGILRLSAHPEVLLGLPSTPVSKEPQTCVSGLLRGHLGIFPAPWIPAAKEGLGAEKRGVSNESCWALAPRPAGPPHWPLLADGPSGAPGLPPEGWATRDRTPFTPAKAVSADSQTSFHASPTQISNSTHLGSAEK